MNKKRKGWSSAFVRSACVRIALTLFVLRLFFFGCDGDAVRTGGGACGKVERMQTQA